jgi:hypothetical protein
MVGWLDDLVKVSDDRYLLIRERRLIFENHEYEHADMMKAVPYGQRPPESPSHYTTQHLYGNVYA